MLSESTKTRNFDGRDEHGKSVKGGVPRMPNAEDLKSAFPVITNSPDEPLTPNWFGTPNIWAAAVGYRLPYYAVYNGGTNHTVVFAYDWNNDEWVECDADHAASACYSIMWKIIIGSEPVKAGSFIGYRTSI